MNSPGKDIESIEDRIAARIDPAVANILPVSSVAGGLTFANMTQVLEFAKMMAISQVAVPKYLRGNPGACLAIVIQAIEWKMSPFAVANKSFSVNDRIGYEAQLINAVILQRAPINSRFHIEFTGEAKGTKTIVVKTREGDRKAEITDGTLTCKVSMELSDPPGKFVEYTSPPIGTIETQNSPLWRADPQQQLFYYSSRALCRRHFPDVLLGIYSEDELPPRENHDETPPADVSRKSIGERLDALAAREHDIDAAKEETLVSEPDDDDKLLALLLEGRAKARDGGGALTMWLHELDAPSYQTLEPHLAELRTLAME